MSKQPKCWRCRLPAPLKPDGTLEHLYRRGDGRRLCMSCIVMLVYEAEMTTVNRASDDLMIRHARHDLLPSLDCPLCAIRSR